MLRIFLAGLKTVCISLSLSDLCINIQSEGSLFTAPKIPLPRFILFVAAIFVTAYSTNPLALNLSVYGNILATCYALLGIFP